MKLQLLHTTALEGDVKEFAFRPPEGFTWTAGQYMHYILPHENEDDRGSERWFTISSAPSEGEIRITTRINVERSSSFKKALIALQPGDEIEADGPEGSFVLQASGHDYLFIVGGIGITPIRSILVEANAKKQPLNATVLYANRSAQDIPFQAELEALIAQNPQLKIQYVIEPDRLDEVTLGDALKAAPSALVYISGPEPMVKSLADTVKNLGVTEENLKLDDFPGYDAI